MRRFALVGLAVGVGGAVGTAGRVGVAEFVEGMGLSSWVALIIVNVCGAFALGWFLGDRDMSRDQARHAAIAVGLLGSFTTFSGFTVQFVEDLRAGSPEAGFVWVVASLVLGLSAALLGRVAGR